MSNFASGKSRGANFWFRDAAFKRGVLEFILEEPFDDRGGVRYEYGRLFAAYGGSLKDPETFNAAVRAGVFAQGR